MKTLFLVQYTLSTSLYMSESRPREEDMIRMVWAETEEEAEALIVEQHPTDPYAVYRTVMINSIEPPLGSPT